MRKRIALSLLALVLAACGSKDEVKTEGSAPAVVPSGNAERPIGDQRRDPEKETRLTQVQIACASDSTMGVFMPNSQQATGHRVRDYLSFYNQEEIASPGILGIRDGVIKLFFFENGRGRMTDFDLNLHKEVGERNRIEAQMPSGSSVYSQLGFSRPRIAAASPDRTVFALATNGGFTVRSFENPSEEKARWRMVMSYANPRWEPRKGGKSEIFLDRLDGDRMRQTWMRIDAANRQAGDEVMPKALFGGHQIGLRRLDDESLIWLEWGGGKAALRVWNLVTDRLKSLEVPPEQAAPGPGFALFRQSNGEKLAVLQSRAGLHFYHIDSDRLTLAFDLQYPKLVDEYIARGWQDWKPGGVYSAANDTQLFAVLPFTWGRMLFAVEDGQFFKMLGHYTCLNPDFYPEFN